MGAKACVLDSRWKAQGGNMQCWTVQDRSAQCNVVQCSAVCGTLNNQMVVRAWENDYFHSFCLSAGRKYGADLDCLAAVLTLVCECLEELVVANGQYSAHQRRPRRQTSVGTNRPTITCQRQLTSAVRQPPSTTSQAPLQHHPQGLVLKS